MPCSVRAKGEKDLTSYFADSKWLSTFMGGYFEKGGCPCASSSAVIPNDHISALYKGSIVVRSHLQWQSRKLKYRIKAII